MYALVTVSDAGDFDRRLSSLHIFSFSLFLLAHRAHSDPEASRGIYKKIFIFVAHAQYPKSPDPHELLPNKAAKSMALCAVVMESMQYAGRWAGYRL